MQEEPFVFHFETKLPVPVEEAFEWHERPGAFERLLPPFMATKLIDCDSGLQLDAHVHFRIMLLGEMGIDCIHKLTDVQKNKSFTDVQVKGPFSSWKHLHNFRKVDEHHTVIEEIIQYTLPVESILGHLVNNKIAKRLSRLFNYRQQILKNDFLFLRNYQKKKLHILVSGASGLVGRSLVALLKTMGHIVTPLKRHLSAGESGIFWDIENQKIDLEELENFDAVIHLAGENIAQFWTHENKEKIYNSRILSTRLLVNSLSQLKRPPKIFITASGAHYYKTGEEVTEKGPEGDGFLHSVIRDWEKEARALQNVRTVQVRTGIVLSPMNGLLKSMVKACKFGLSARFGAGEMHLSWISIDDLAYLYAHILMTESIEGPVNATAPFPVTQDHFLSTLAKILKRPFFLKIPKILISSMGGELGKELLLADLKVLPRKLMDNNYTFFYPKIEQALKHLLGTL